MWPFKKRKLDACPRVWKKLGRLRILVLRMILEKFVTTKKAILVVINGKEGFIDLPSDLSFCFCLFFFFGFPVQVQ